MAKRRKSYNKYVAADSSIARMERAVVNRTVELDGLTAHDWLRWLVPEDDIRKLRDAVPLVENYGGDTDNTIKLHRDVFKMVDRLPPLPGDPPIEITKVEPPHSAVRIAINCLEMGLPRIKDAVLKVQPDAPHAERLAGICHEIYGIVARHNTLRRIINWLNSHGTTYGAAKHYFPGLRSLLPSDHPFHKVKSDRFKDLHIEPAIVELMREAPGIVAAGLLADPEANGNASYAGTALVRLNAVVDGNGGQVFPMVRKR